MSDQAEELDLENVKVIFPDGETKKYPKPLHLAELLKHKSLSSPDIISLMVNCTSIPPPTMRQRL